MTEQANSASSASALEEPHSTGLLEQEGTAIRLRHDFLASIVVFLVALPLCMGVAIASGVPVASGLITGIVGGLVVGGISGSPMQVSGPAAGLTVIIYALIQEQGLERLGITVLLAGGLQLLAGVFRLGQWFRAVSPAVIKGMLAGIGLLIFSSQFHVMVDDTPRKNGISNLLTIPESIRKGLPWPDWGTPAENRRHADMLQQIGALHERQVQVRELVDESVAQDASPDQFRASAPFTEELIAEQTAINARLEELSRTLQEAAGDSPQNKDDAEAASTSVKAVARGQAALDDLRNGHVLESRSSQQKAEESLARVLRRLKNHDWAAKVGLLTILLIVGWQLFVPKKFRLIPAPLIAVVIVTSIAWVSSLPVLYVEIPDNLFAEIHLPTLATLSAAPWGLLLKSAAVIAVIASAETLLCATAVDQIHQGPRTKYDRELAAQGIGNMICGFLGALPMTGVIVRSAANVQAGARSRLSAVLHGAWLLAFVAALSFVLRAIPTACLAGILVYTGYKLMDPKSVRELWNYGKGEVAIYFATVIMIVSTNLLTGVLVGVALSAVKLLHTFSHLRADLTVQPAARTARLSLHGAATFVGLPKLAAKLEDVPPNVELHVDFDRLDYIDHACLDLLMNWAKQHAATGGRLVIDWESLHANFRRNREPARTDDRTATALAPSSDPTITHTQQPAAGS